MWFVEVTLFCFIGNTPWIATGWSLLSSTSCVKSKRKQVGPMRFLKLSTGILNARQIQTYTIWTKNYRPTNHLEKLKVPSSSATEAHVKGTLYAPTIHSHSHRWTCSSQGRHVFQCALNYILIWEEKYKLAYFSDLCFYNLHMFWECNPFCAITQPYSQCYFIEHLFQL